MLLFLSETQHEAASGGNVSTSPGVCLSAVQTVTKRGVGGSSFVAGYKRILTPQDSIDMHAMLGGSWFPDCGCTCAG